MAQEAKNNIVVARKANKDPAESVTDMAIGCNDRLELLKQKGWQKGCWDYSVFMVKHEMFGVLVNYYPGSFEYALEGKPNSITCSTTYVHAGTV